jgi:hypothetical protein
MSERLDLGDPIAVLLRVASALRACGVENAAYGGLALAVYGEPRETKDADLAVAGADSLVSERALRALGVEVVKAFDRVRFGGNSITRFTLVESAGGAGLNTADLVEPRSTRYAHLALDRATEGTLRGEPIRILTPEDFVVFKVLSTRERDLEDGATVLRALGSRLDRARIASDLAALVAEISDHDIAARFDRMRDLASQQP